MEITGAIITGAAAAFLAAAAGSGVIAWAGPVDRPRERGSHKIPTPTSGGLGVIAGTSLGLWLFTALAPAPHSEVGKIAAAFGIAALLGLIGALDDLYDLGAKPKLLAQAILSLLFAVFVAHIEAIPIWGAQTLMLGPILGVIGTALWLVVATNAVNFMDGANGLAPGTVCIALIAFAYAGFHGGDHALGGAALMTAAATLGFLPWNFPKGRLFQGDAGALFSSFLLAALAVMGAGPSGRGPVFVFFVPLALMPLLTDVLLTLLSRAQAKKKLFDAHKEHLYQRWLSKNGGSHVALAWRAYAATALFAGGAIALLSESPALKVAGFLSGTVVAATVWAIFRRRCV